MKPRALSLFPAAALLAAALLVPVAAPAAPSGEGKSPAVARFFQERRQVRSLSRDIALLELINQLDLSSDQSRRLLDMARRAEDAWRRYLINDPVVRDALAEAKAAYQDLRIELLAGGAAHPQVAARAQAARARLREAKDRAREALKRDLRDLENEAAQVLSPRQLAAVEGYRRSPGGAAGVDEAAGAAAALDILDRVRAMNPAEYPAWREAIAYDLAGWRKGLNEAQQTAEAARVLNILDTARGLSPANYAAARASLARDLGPDAAATIAPAVAKREQDDCRRGRRSPVARWLLDRHIIPLLAERLGEATRPVVFQEGETLWDILD